MQPVRPTPPVHHPPGKFVDDNDLAVFHDVVGIAFEHHIGLQGLVEMVNDDRVLVIVQVGSGQQSCAFEQPFGLFGPVLGERQVPGLLVFFIIAFVELQHNGVHLHIKFGLVIGGT